MKLSALFEAVAFKRLVAVDLPNQGSHQHELNGVSAFKVVFGTAAKTETSLDWWYFEDGSDPLEEKGQVTFYDSRARSAARTGRSEWRLYYHGNLLKHASVGDAFVLLRTTEVRYIGLITKAGSAAHREVMKAFGLDLSTAYDVLPSAVLETRDWEPQHIPILSSSLRLTAKAPATSEEDQTSTHGKAATPPPEPDPVKMDEAGLRHGELSFKPRARMLMLLGDQLIRDAGIAIFELVKNGYDADATEVTITLSHVTDREKGRVIVEDNGSGMNWEQVVNVWLEPGTDYRQKQKQSGYRTPLFHRLPLGEKGVGRFAAHKLGRLITMITRQPGAAEVVVTVDWDALLAERYLSRALVSTRERAPQFFTGDTSGTRIEISSLNEELSRGTIRQIHRAVASITSPFQGPSEFSAKMEVIPSDASLAGLLKIDTVLDLAPYRANCLIENGELTYDYSFTPPRGLERIEGRSVTQKRIPIRADKQKEFSLAALRELLGPFLIDFRIYDLDAQVLQYSVSDKKGFKDFLRQNGGVRVYRDGVRVYDYGEPGNDWLDLGGNRVNQPTGRISNNQIIAAVHLDGQTSGNLVEKTNREGFIEDAAYKAFRGAVEFALTQVVFERNLDKNRLRLLYANRRMRQPVLTELSELREALSQLPSGPEELVPMVDAVETQYLEMRDTLMTAAGAGLTLAVVIHEVEKAIAGLGTAVDRNASPEELRELATHLNELVEGLTYLTRKSGRRNEHFSLIARQAVLNTKYRARAHRIRIIDGIEAGDPDPAVNCTRRLVIACVMNLIDNSIYWLDAKSGEDRRVYIGSTVDLAGGPTLFVADTGPGFQDAPESLVQPFMSRRPEGMGLGLHIADMVIKAHNGRLVFPTPQELNLDDSYVGAIVGLQFENL